MTYALIGYDRRDGAFWWTQEERREDAISLARGGLKSMKGLYRVEIWHGDRCVWAGRRNDPWEESYVDTYPEPDAEQVFSEAEAIAEERFSL